MERRLGQPFGVARYNFRIAVTFSALSIDVPSRYRQERFYRMWVMAINAAGLAAVKTFAILLKDRGMAFLACCPGGSDPVIGMTFGYPVMTGHATDTCVSSDSVFHRINESVTVSFCDYGPISMTFYTFAVFLGIRINCRCHEQKHQWKQKQNPPDHAHRFSSLLAVSRRLSYPRMLVHFFRIVPFKTS